MAKSTTTKDARQTRIETWSGVMLLVQDIIWEAVDEDQTTVEKIAERAHVSPQTVKNFIADNVDGEYTKSPHFTTVAAILMAHGVVMELPLGNGVRLRLIPDEHKEYVGQAKRTRRRIKA